MSRLLDPRFFSCSAQSLARIHYSFFGLSDRVWKARGFLPIEWPKNLWLECRGPRISVPLVLQWSSARTVTVSALNQYSPHFATQILWYACMQHETIINSRFSCTLDVNTTWSLVSTNTKALIKTGRILRLYKLNWLKQMSMWRKEAHCTSIFYKCINQRERNKLFSTKSQWPTYYMDIFLYIYCQIRHVGTTVTSHVSEFVHRLRYIHLYLEAPRCRSYWTLGYGHNLKKISVVQRANIRPTLLLNYRWWSNKGDARLLYWKQILSGRYPREIRPLWSLYF